MPASKPTHRKSRAPRRAPSADGEDGRNAVNFILNNTEHASLHADLRRVAFQTGLPTLTMGRYAKHALLSYNRLRNIESKLRHWLLELSTPRSNGDRILASDVSDQLRFILETPVTG